MRVYKFGRNLYDDLENAKDAILDDYDPSIHFDADFEVYVAEVGDDDITEYVEFPDDFETLYFRVSRSGRVYQCR